MKPTHVVADDHYGFIYTKDQQGHLLNELTAQDLADTLNAILGGRGYTSYRLTPERNWLDYEAYPVMKEVSDAAH